MADLASTDVTVTLSTAVSPNPNIIGGRREAWVSMAFGDGSLKYPVGGVPLPSIAKFGMVRNIAAMLLQGPTGLQGGYDPTNHKMLIYSHKHVLAIAQGATADAAAASVNASSADLYISQPSGGGGVLSLAGKAVGSTTNVGGIVSAAPGTLEELGNVAVAAQTWAGLVYGW